MSKIVRALKGWRCEYCGPKSKDYSNRKQGLHAHHYFGRGRWSTRYDFDNCIALCYPHHLMFHRTDPDGTREAWMRQRLGEERFERLLIRSRYPVKKRQILDDAEQMVGELEELIQRDPARAKMKVGETVA